MNILIAPNAFKHSIDAKAAAAAIAAGFEQSGLGASLHLFPVGDGGDGTGSLLSAHLQCSITSVSTYDPLGRPITATYGLTDDGKTAIIEMADASGIRLLQPDELNPLKTSTYGTGIIIKAALDAGVSKIILAIGGSATVDGGAGILNALGVKFLKANGNFLKAVPESSMDTARIDASGLDERMSNCEILVLCDVDNPLLGAYGAAKVFGPQKGASPSDVVFLEHWLETFATLTYEAKGKDISNIKHGGAAGGIAAGLSAFLNAQLMPGADTFLDITGFDQLLDEADLLITAEGSIDEQTLQGKAPAVVAKRAKMKGIKVIGLAGNIALPTSPTYKDFFDELICINSQPIDLPTALKNAAVNLQRAAFQIGRSLLG